jgi:hypothetical protein
MGISTFSKQTLNTGVSDPVGSGNFIINGAFESWSRGTTFTGQNYNADRFQMILTNSTATHSRQAFAPGELTAPSFGNPVFFLRSVVTSAGNAGSRAFFLQRVEDGRTLAGQQVTVSFYAKAATGTPKMAVELRQNVGLGGVNPTNIPFGAVTISTSWARYSLTGTLPSLSTSTLGPDSNLLVNIWVDSGSDNAVLASNIGNQSNTFDIWGVQLEAGPVATPFKPAGGSKSLDTVATGSAGYDGVLVATSSATNPFASGTPAWAGYDVAGKNKIINGAFNFWQRGISLTANNIFTADRWFFAPFGTGTPATISRLSSNLPVGFEYGLRMIAPTTTNANFNLLTSLESASVIPLRNLSVTLSFYYRVPVNFTGPVSPLILWSTATDARLSPSNGTGISSPFLANTTSWTRYTQTFVMPATATSFAIGWQAYNNVVQNAEIQITGVQLEVGTTATSFSLAGGTIQGELAACQRYYQRLGNVAYSTIGTGYSFTTTRNFIGFNFLNTFRSAPTRESFANLIITDRAAYDSSVTAISGEVLSPSSYWAEFTASGVTAGRFAFLTSRSNGDGFIGFSAEL